MSQGFVRAIALCAIAAMFWTAGRRPVLDCRPLIIFLAAWTGLIALQIVPLPPALWSSLPGREILVRFYEVMGIAQPWRPISLQPAATTNALLAMLVPWATLLLAGKLRDDAMTVEFLLAGFLLITMAIGALQMASGGHSFYFYRITNEGSPVGIFANRNHQAFVSVMLIPLLVRIIFRTRRNRPLSPSVWFLIAGVTFAVLINILITGSRMGLLLFLVAAAATGAQLPSYGKHRALMGKERKNNASSKRNAGVRNRKLVLLTLAVLGILVTAMGILAAYSDRFIALSRLAAGGESEEGRLKYIPPVWELVEKYFPLGSGFGTFPTVFKIDEPDSMLRLSYLNHAHNDVLEILVEGGVISGILALAFFAFWVARSLAVWLARRGTADSEQIRQARLGSVLSGLLLLGSVTDYPLRTPTCAAIFAISCFWLFRKGEPSFDH